jgi:glycosyltransferase involved in cell wall biosynthesis
VTARAALIFDVYLGYHHARLDAARGVAEVVGIEIAGRSNEYDWAESTAAAHCHTLFPKQRSAEIAPRDLREVLFAHLDAIAPDVVFVPGWSTPAALLSLSWCGLRQCAAIMMCDSTAGDAPRAAVREAPKRALLSGCAAAFVSGSRSARYVQQLGMSAAHVHTGYDVVDVQAFAEGADAARGQAATVRAEWSLPEDYLLCVCRLVEKKNVHGLLAAYRLLRDAASRAVPDLVIAGAGPERARLEALRDSLGLAENVRFLGHVDNVALPALYGLARALVLPSLIEPWGLVVNEAIAAGLPVLISDRCGACDDLVTPSVNGWHFAPDDASSIAAAMSALLAHDDRAALSRASRMKAAQWGLPRFQAGVSASIATALSRRHVPSRTTMLLAETLARLPIPRAVA